MEQIEPALLSRHGSNEANLANIMSAIQSIRGEGMKTGLVSATPGMKSDLFPVSNSLFDAVSKKYFLLVELFAVYKILLYFKLFGGKIVALLSLVILQCAIQRYRKR